MKPRDMGQFSFFLSKRRERAIALPSTQISTEISNIAAEKFEFSDTFPCNGGCLGLITRRPPVVTSYSVAVCLQCSVTTGFAFNINWSCNGSLGRQLGFATKQEGKLLLNCLFLPTFFLIWKLTALKTFFYLNSHHFEPLHFLAAFFFFFIIFTALGNLISLIRLNVLDPRPADFCLRLEHSTFLSSKVSEDLG